MPVSIGSYGQGSCWDTVKAGITSGFCVGVVSGLVLESFSCYHNRIKGRELVSKLSRRMLKTGGSFAVFMGIGYVIRC